MPTSTSTVVSGSLAVNATTDVGADYYMDITINEPRETEHVPDTSDPGVSLPSGIVHAKAASGMFRHNGQGYLSHGAIRFLEDAIQLGGDEQRIQADATGLKMLDPPAVDGLCHPRLPAVDRDGERP